MSKSCLFVKNYSEKLWKYISDVYSYKGMRVAEIGITNDFIFSLLKYYNSFPGLCDIYINHSFDEKTRGADIELVIFDKKGKGRKYFIQCKRINCNGFYEDIKKWNHMTPPQFEKLIEWSKSNSGTPLYLLYTGLTPNSKLGNSQYGLSIIDANIISEFRYNQHYHKTNLSIANFSFDKLFTMGIAPLHELFCPGSATVFLPTVSVDFIDFRIGEQYQLISNLSEVDLITNEFITEKNNFTDNSPLYKVVIKDFE